MCVCLCVCLCVCVCICHRCVIFCILLYINIVLNSITILISNVACPFGNVNLQLCMHRTGYVLECMDFVGVLIFKCPD